VDQGNGDGFVADVVDEDPLRMFRVQVDPLGEEAAGDGHFRLRVLARHQLEVDFLALDAVQLEYTSTVLPPVVPVSPPVLLKNKK